VAFYIVGEHPELIGERLDAHAEGILEEAREVRHRAGLAFSLGELGEPDEIEDERRRQDRVATLPDELHAHLRPEKSAEVNEVPRRLPVAERRDVLDGHAGVRRIAECCAEHAGLASDLGALVAGVGEHPAVAPTQDVEALPGEHLEVSVTEHRCEDRLHQSLAGLAVAPVEGHVVLQPELLQRWHGHTDRWREIYVWEPALQCRVGIHHARCDERAPVLLDHPAEPVESLVIACQLEWRLG